MTTRVLGTLTIGQAPRPDVVPILDAHIPAAVRRIHCGLLDGLTRAEIDRRYRPGPGDRLLVTRLADGDPVQLSAASAARGVQEKLEALEGEGCDVILLLCTGMFDGLECRRAWLVEPDRIIPPLIAGLAGRRRLGIIVPLAAQIGSESGKWRGLRCPPRFASASPYGEAMEELIEAGAQLVGSGAEALLLDCIGFTERHRAALTAATGLPVILSNAVVAKAVGELLAP